MAVGLTPTACATARAVTPSGPCAKQSRRAARRIRALRSPRGREALRAVVVGRVNIVNPTASRCRRLGQALRACRKAEAGYRTVGARPSPRPRVRLLDERAAR